MHSLVPVAAHDALKPLATDFGALSIAENEGVALASLALRRSATLDRVMGVDLPGPGAWARGDAAAAFWIGPDQWMIEAQGRAETDFAQSVRRAAPGCSITEQTDGWVVFDILSDNGAAPVERLLERLVNLDLNAFGPGRATRTVLDHLGVFVIRRDEAQVSILGPRSSAGSLWSALSGAATRLGAGRRLGSHTEKDRS